MRTLADWLERYNLPWWSCLLLVRSEDRKTFFRVYPVEASVQQLNSMFIELSCDEGNPYELNHRNDDGLAVYRRDEYIGTLGRTEFVINLQQDLPLKLQDDNESFVAFLKVRGTNKKRRKPFLIDIVRKQGLKEYGKLTQRIFQPPLAPP